MRRRSASMSQRCSAKRIKIQQRRLEKVVLTPLCITFRALQRGDKTFTKSLSLGLRPKHEDQREHRETKLKNWQDQVRMASENEQTPHMDVEKDKVVRGEKLITF